MISIAHFSQFIALALCLAALLMGQEIYRAGRDRALKAYLAFLLGWCVIIFAHVLEAFLKAVLLDEVYDKHLRDILYIAIIPLAALRLYMAWGFLFLSYLWMERKPSKYLLPFLGTYFILFVPVAFLEPFNPEFSHFFREVIILSIHVILNVSIIWGALLFREKKRKLAAGFVVFALLNLGLRLVNFMEHRIHEDVQMLGLGLVVMVFGLLNVLFIRRVFRLQRKLSEPDFDELAANAGITRRESEIIRLICQGKTNKEIAERLFISPVTVRDHTSNIYRKTGVRSRTQLASNFSPSLRAGTGENNTRG